MSQKRVAVVLASLVGTMTVSAAALLVMEGGALGTNLPGAFVADTAGMISSLEPDATLQEGKWNYIIIYESGDEMASAVILPDGQVTGGRESTHTVRPQAKFHFVIESNRYGTDTRDGALEIRANWKQQATGAPYAGWPDPRSYSYSQYDNAVGVCLVGNLNRTPISSEQHQSLLQVVQKLQRRLNIPSERILFHWDRRLGARQPTPAQASYDERFHNELK